MLFRSTFAHAYEALAGYDGGLLHGEAVAIGIALDTLYSAAQGLLPRQDAERVIALLTALGFALDHPALQALDVDTALADFREHLGGALSIPLLAGIGLVAVFAGAANTPLACTLMAIELFGGGVGVYAALACATSYACSGHHGIYRAQRVDAPKHRPVS